MDWHEWCNFLLLHCLAARGCYYLLSYLLIVYRCTSTGKDILNIHLRPLTLPTATSMRLQPVVQPSVTATLLNSQVGWEAYGCPIWHRLGTLFSVDNLFVQPRVCSPNEIHSSLNHRLQTRRLCVFLILVTDTSLVTSRRTASLSAHSFT